MDNLKRLALLSVLFAVSGCGGTADALGLGRNAPDEFAVVDRPPLSMPPDFELRPPRPGAPRPQEVKTTDRASQMLFGGEKMNAKAHTSGATSDSEKALLDSAGTAKAEPRIREVLDREASQKVVGSTPLIEEILWWRDPSSSATTVDAAAEAKRIKEAKEKGESVTSSATPIIEKSKSGWLGL